VKKKTGDLTTPPLPFKNQNVKPELKSLYCINHKKIQTKGRPRKHLKTFNAMNGARKKEWSEEEKKRGGGGVTLMSWSNKGSE